MPDCHGKFLFGSESVTSVLLTGSRGLIGKSLSQRLEKSGLHVVKLDCRGTLEEDDYGSITEPCQILEKMTSCEGVIHLAAVSRVIWGEQDPSLCFLTNHIGTKNIVDAALSMPKPPWIIYASSREVYGEQSVFPVHESAQLQPMNTYARTKTSAEKIIRDGGRLGLKTAILRFANVFGGANDYDDRVIPAFCLAALKNQPLRLEGKCNTFDFTYLEDVVSGTVLGVQHLIREKSSLPPIHFTTGKGRTLEEAANRIIAHTNSSSEIIEAPSRTFDVSHFIGDPSRAKELLGWSPQYSFDEALKKYIALLQKHAQCTRGYDENNQGYSRISADL